jgi:hypothetical protein
MASSSKKKSGSSTATTTAQPDATQALPGGVSQQYYSNPVNVPTTGGLVLPTAAPGMLQGAGLNYYTPPAPVTRNTLASTISNAGNSSDQTAASNRTGWGSNSR